jgi:hypothetical protein
MSNPGTFDSLTVAGQSDLNGGTHTNTLTVDGNVGVGTSTPGGRLQVVDAGCSLRFAAEGGSAVLRVENSAAASLAVVDLGNSARAWQLRVDGGDGNKFKLFDATRIDTPVTVDTAGNVGIGTTKPGASLQLGVLNNAVPPNTSLAVGTSNGVSLNVPAVRISMGVNNDANYGGYVGTLWMSATTGQVATVLGTREGGTDFANTVAVTRGNVGIGAINPKNKLQVEGNLHMDGNSIFLRQNPDDQFDFIRWNPAHDRVEIGGYSGVAFGHTRAIGGPTLTPVLAVGSDDAGSGAKCISFLREPNDEVNAGKIAYKAPGWDNNALCIVGAGTVPRKIHMWDDVEVNHDLRVNGDVVLTGADCAEDFDVVRTESIEPGTVMVIDQEGALRPSQEPYDKRVAGVISGAGGLSPGIVLDKKTGSVSRLPLGLVGKVYCKVDATLSPIEVGDLLTTSATLGHAMRATDPTKAFGTVLGKALHRLESGQGLIPILIALQ